MVAQVKQRLSFFAISNKRAWLFPGLFIMLGVLGLAILWSITLGAAEIDRRIVYNAIFHYDASNFDHLVIRVVRLPRVLAGVLVGASLGVSGATMQGLTRNPLADPGLLGISSGAALGVVSAVYFLGAPSLTLYAIFAFVGGAITATVVYGMASFGHGGATPLKLTLSGVIVGSFVASITSAILVTDAETLDQIRFWLVGTLAGRDMEIVQQTAPYMLVGLVASLLISRQITTINLGDDVAKGLGQNTLRVKAFAAVTVVLLAGGSVALAGPVGFVGLITPHLVRMWVGVDYRWVIPYSAIVGALLVTVADVYARIIIRPQEVSVGVMLCLIGVPFFVYLARWKVKG